MENFSGVQTHFNVALAKSIGLYQILDPKSMKFRNYNVYHIATLLCISYLFLFTPILFLNFIYIWENHLIKSLQHFSTSILLLHICYKGYVIVRHSDKIRDVLSITQFDFTLCGLRYRSMQDVWQSKSSMYTQTFTIMKVLIITSYMLFPLTLTDTYVTMKKQNGMVSNYRLNIMNIHAFVSDETYNKYFILYYLAEALVLIIYLYLSNVFDTLLITLCFSMSCQLNIVNTAFESVGHQSPVRDRRPLSTKDTAADNEILVINECDVVYNEIISIITDRHKVMKKLGLFFLTFQNVILSQIFVSSSALIIVWFSVVMSFTEEDMPGSRGTTIKMLSLFNMYMFQMFMTCYLIGNIHNHKDAIIFALYSSNWTKMSMKCKKLILFTMRMNNAHRCKLQFTRTKIVNLEMFFITIRFCYSIFSMLMKYKQSKYQ